jgi:hypothetical protein
LKIAAAANPLARFKPGSGRRKITRKKEKR